MNAKMKNGEIPEVPLPGMAVTVNTNTAPTPTGNHYMKTTILAIGRNGCFTTSNADPYFGYNVFHLRDIVSFQ